MNSYLLIKEFIFKKLQNFEGALPSGKIDEEIKNIKKLISEFGIETTARFLSVDQLSNLSDKEWSRMQKEFEAHFDVAMDPGVLIQGEEQRQRDHTWWTGTQKQRGENYYWERYKKYIKESLPPEVVKAIDVDTDIVMDNIGNSKIEEFNRYGMVVGHVQSGKTSNYSALVCKAADAGYKFVVVVAGGLNNLRNQTQERLNEAFIGFEHGKQVGVGKGNSCRERLPISLTTKESDFNKQDADRNSQKLNFDNINVPILLIIKKNTKTLSNVISWLKAQYKNQIAEHSMLMIDDESDYASINTGEEEDPSTINKKLRELLSLFYKKSYVAYTATPYANIFIDHEVDTETEGRDLFPKDFIYALDAPTNYFGARKIFLESDEKYLVSVGDHLDYIPANHKKDFSLPDLPPSLYDAVRLFIMNVGIRHLRGQASKHNSMLIHATRFTAVHQKIGTHIENYLSEIKKALQVYGKLPGATVNNYLLEELKGTFDARYDELEFNWEDVLRASADFIEDIVIREVHQKKSVALEYGKEKATNAIVIGGTSLSRGYTLEGLSVSYFLRNTLFYDTLMQMGRWFGYRDGYKGICKIYMPPSVISNFSHIIEATEDLMDDFKKMSEAKMTPKNFGLAVRQHPDTCLQVTAKNKQKNTGDIYVDMKLDGKAKETAWLHSDKEIKYNNLKAVHKIIKRVQTCSRDSEIKRKYLWRDVKKEVIADFLNDFKVYESDPFGIRARMPINFIKKYVEDVETLWDVAIYSGDSKEDPYEIGDITFKRECRIVKNKGKYYEVQNRQVSSGSAEAIVLSEEERKKLGSKRKEIREKMKKPLLMLHILETRIQNNKLEDPRAFDNKLAAFGISFPGGIKSKSKTVRLKANSVYLQEIQKLLNEQEADDYER